jgi:AAA family ATP:ADP antiporter
MMLIAALLLLVCIGLTSWINQRERTANSEQSQESRDSLATSAGGFQLVMRHRYLFLIAILVLISNLVNTTGEFILGKTVSEAAKRTADEEAFIGQFYANFYFWVNLLGAALQMFVVSRIMKYIGVGAALFCLPLIALGSYTLLAFAPVLGLIRIAKIAENSTDYSVQNTVRHALFLNTSRDAKYKAQSAIESFFWRMGDAISAVLVFVGTTLAFGIRDFALINAGFVVVWLAIAGAIVRLRARRTSSDAEIHAAA